MFLKHLPPLWVQYWCLLFRELLPSKIICKIWEWIRKLKVWGVIFFSWAHLNVSYYNWSWVWLTVGTALQWLVQQQQVAAQQNAQALQQTPLTQIQPPGPTIESIVQQQQALHEQTAQSEQNLNAQHMVFMKWSVYKSKTSVWNLSCKLLVSYWALLRKRNKPLLQYTRTRFVSLFFFYRSVIFL